MARAVKRRVRTQKYGSMSELKKSLKKKGGASLDKMSYIPEDGITVRFLHEPPEWLGYYEHYTPDADIRYSPCYGGECCQEAEDKPSFRYLANAQVVDDGKVQAVKLPKSVVDQLTKFAEKYGTILDRDYELSRTGSGMKTEYSALPESKSPMNLKRYRREMFDLEDLLAELLSDLEDDEDDEDEPDTDDYDDDEEEEDDEPPQPRGPRSRRARERLKDHPGGMDEFRPRKKSSKPASTRGVEDEDEPRPRAKKRTVSRSTQPTKPVKRAVRRTR